MGVTLATLRTKFKRHYPDANNELIDEFVNDAHKGLSLEYPLFYDVLEISVTESVAEYSLGEDTGIVFYVDYLRTETSRARLRMVLWEEMPPEFESFSNGIPSIGTIRGNNLIISPPPNSTTVLGYPKIAVSRTKTPERISLGFDEIAGAIPDDRPVLVKALLLYAEIHDRPMVGYWKNEYMEENRRMNRLVTGRKSGHTLIIYPPRERRRVL